MVSKQENEQTKKPNQTPLPAPKTMRVKLEYERREYIKSQNMKDLLVTTHFIFGAYFTFYKKNNFIKDSLTALHPPFN